MKKQHGQFAIEHAVLLGSLSLTALIVSSRLGDFSQAIYSWVQLIKVPV